MLSSGSTTSSFYSAVAARATALRNPKGLRRIDRALEELECVEDIQIANQGLAHNHSANRGFAAFEYAEPAMAFLDAINEFIYAS